MTLARVQLEEFARESTASVRVLRALAEVVEKAGVPQTKFLLAARLGPEDVSASDTRIPLSKLYGAVELALDLTGDPALGLHWAETIDDGTFIPISHLIAHAATLRQGFEALSHFGRLLNDDVTYDSFELGDKVTIRRKLLDYESVRVQRFSSEMMVAGICRLLQCTSRDARAQVTFSYPAPAYRAEYERVLGAEVRFEQPFTGVVFDRAILDLPAPHKDDDVHEALHALAERRLLRVTKQTPYALRARDLLVQHRGPLRTDMNTIARLLGLSVRSLRRRLTDEGKPYGEVANEALTIIVKHLLRDKQRTIQETAHEMGFSDASTFHRAFKRWTGTTPTAFREARRQEEK